MEWVTYPKKSVVDMSSKGAIQDKPAPLPPADIVQAQVANLMQPAVETLERQAGMLHALIEMLREERSHVPTIREPVSIRTIEAPIKLGAHDRHFVRIWVPTVQVIQVAIPEGVPAVPLRLAPGVWTPLTGLPDGTLIYTNGTPFTAIIAYSYVPLDAPPTASASGFVFDSQPQNLAAGQTYTSPDIDVSELHNILIFVNDSALVTGPLTTRLDLKSPDGTYFEVFNDGGKTTPTTYVEAMGPGTDPNKGYSAELGQIIRIRAVLTAGTATTRINVVGK